MFYKQKPFKENRVIF